MPEKSVTRVHDMQSYPKLQSALLSPVQKQIEMRQKLLQLNVAMGRRRAVVEEKSPWQTPR
jgi:hypothetical protein